MARRLPTLVLMVVTACASTTYRRAAEADTIAAYRAFLREKPDDENAEAAKARLAELELDRVNALHTVIAYKRFLEEFPDSPKAADVRALLETQRFNSARERGTLEALTQFTREHPDGAHREEAQRMIDAARLVEASKLTDPNAAEAALSGMEPSAQHEAAAAVADDRSYTAAVNAGASALINYLRDHPAGAHREEAKIQLLSLKLDGLLFSDLLEEARAEAQKSPLGAKVADLQARFARAAADRAITQSPDPKVQAAQAANYLRSIEDLERSLHAPDALDRWEAAEELGQWISVRSIDPLLLAVHSARNARVRERAFESLGQVLRSLPRPVAQYEVAVRIEQLQERASDAEVYLELAALRDLSGHLEAAVNDYQKAFEPSVPDPVVLERWVRIRRERRQFFSSAVAARQLALWARGVAESADTAAPAGFARELCAASEAAGLAVETIAAARQTKTEFPDDLSAFELAARDAQKLVDARLKDAELALKTLNPDARTCGDSRVADRVTDAVRARLDALRASRKQTPSLADRILTLARERDPAPEVRAVAAQLLTGAP